MCAVKELVDGSLAPDAARCRMAATAAFIAGDPG
jgi:hypothetical protein